MPGPGSLLCPSPGPCRRWPSRFLRFNPDPTNSSPLLLMKTCPILLVDDNMDDVLLAQLAFRMNNGDNVVVHCVHDGEEAMAYLTGKNQYSDRQQFPMPQYVLLDLNLPKASGFEVLAWLRQEPGLKRIPVILLSGTNEPANVNAAYELGVTNYLKKP